MPIVLRVDGFEVVILLPPREHGPAHVHVRKAGELVVINLDVISIRKVRMGTPNVRAALRIVAEHRDHLLAEWKRIHG
jgi:hypothetical protein